MLWLGTRRRPPWMAMIAAGCLMGALAAWIPGDPHAEIAVAVDATLLLAFGAAAAASDMAAQDGRGAARRERLAVVLGLGMAGALSGHAIGLGDRQDARAF